MLPMQLQAGYEALPYAMGGGAAALLLYSQTAAPIVAAGASAVGTPVLGGVATVAGGAVSFGTGAALAGKTAYTTSLASMIMGQKMVETMQEGGNPTVAFWAGLPGFAFQAWIETAKWGQTLALAIPGKAKGLAKIAERTVAKYMGPNGAWTKFVQGVGRFVGTWTTEMGEEEIQALGDAFSDDLGGQIRVWLGEEGVEFNTIESIVQMGKDTFNESWEAITGMVGGSAMFGTMLDMFTKDEQTKIKEQISRGGSGTASGTGPCGYVAS